MRIGVDATPLSVPQSGVGTYTANLIRALAEPGTDDVVPLLHRPVHPSFRHELEGITVPLEPNGDRRRGSTTLWMQTALPRRIRRSGVDLCHFTNGVAPVRCPCPHVVTIHDVGLWLHPEYHYPRRLLALRPLVPWAARRADAVIVPSHAVRHELIGVLGLPAGKVRVVPQAASPRFHRSPTAARLDRVRRVHRLPERFILTVGSLEPRKNLVRLLEAHSLLTAEPGLGDVGLVLAGPWGWKYGPLLDALEDLRPGAPVSVLGPVDGATVVALYHLASVVAFPSLYEGFGLPLLEAMTCGTPVVTSNRGALAEVAGDAAELVEPTRVDSIAQGLRRVLEDGVRADLLRARGLERAAAFSWTQAAWRMRGLYAEVTGGAMEDVRSATSVSPSAPPAPAAPAPPALAAVPAVPPHRAPDRTPAGTLAVHPAAGRAAALERAVLRTLAYGDVFDFPMTAAEVHRYLIGVAATRAEVDRVLANGRLVPGRVARVDGVFTLPGRQALAGLRRARGDVAGRLMPRAVHYGRAMARLPFVRMVAVTGSLAAGNIESDSDVDYLIITASGRLWLCRAMVIGLVRLARRQGTELCPNYLRSESALELEEKDLYTAWELAQMIPVAGIETYRRLRDRNEWARAFLPNAQHLPGPAPAGNSGRGGNGKIGGGGPVLRLAEQVLAGPAGAWLEGWERGRKVRRLTREAAAAGPASAREVGFSAEWCKGHFGGHRGEVLARYEARLEALEAGW